LFFFLLQTVFSPVLPRFFFCQSCFFDQIRGCARLPPNSLVIPSDDFFDFVPLSTPLPSPSSIFGLITEKTTPVSVSGFNRVAPSPFFACAPAPFLCVPESKRVIPASTIPILASFPPCPQIANLFVTNDFSLVPLQEIFFFISCIRSAFVLGCHPS